MYQTSTQDLPIHGENRCIPIVLQSSPNILGSIIILSVTDGHGPGLTGSRSGASEQRMMVVMVMLESAQHGRCLLCFRIDRLRNSFREREESVADPPQSLSHALHLAPIVLQSPGRTLTGLGWIHTEGPNP